MSKNAMNWLLYPGMGLCFGLAVVWAVPSRAPDMPAEAAKSIGYSIEGRHSAYEFRPKNAPDHLCVYVDSNSAGGLACFKSDPRP